MPAALWQKKESVELRNLQDYTLERLYSGNLPARRSGRYVAMFYFLWDNAAPNVGLYDVSKILAADPNAMKTTDSPPWAPRLAMHYWGEPLFGYYVAEDPWVIRKHAQMLESSRNHGSSVLNGEAGRSSLLNRLTSGAPAHP
jgi:hypothetical protein